MYRQRWVVALVMLCGRLLAACGAQSAPATPGVAPFALGMFCGALLAVAGYGAWRAYSSRRQGVMSTSVDHTEHERVEAALRRVAARMASLHEIDRGILAA